MTIHFKSNKGLKAPNPNEHLAVILLRQGTEDNGWVHLIHSDVICSTSKSQVKKGIFVLRAESLPELVFDLNKGHIAYEIIN